MKHNWEYKQLGDVCDELFAGGDVPKDHLQIKDEVYRFPIYTNGVVDEGLYGYSSKPKVTKKAVTISGRGTIGAVFKRFKPFTPAIRLITAIPYEYVTIEFLAYALKSITIQSNGAAIPQLTIPMVKGRKIPVPPMEVQEQIVAELDKINELIDDHREMLRQLDDLAQSLFYDTFGDPSSNPKGWEVKALENVCTVTSSRRIFAQEYCDCGIPFFRGKEISELSRGDKISVELFISKERYSKLSSKDIPLVGDILITAVGTIGNIWTVDMVKPFYFKDGNIIWLKEIDSTIINPTAFNYVLKFLIEKEKQRMAIGAAYKAITIQNLNKLRFPLPPLALQESFARKIEAIEAQKADIEASITELQTLLDSRMDYWFN